jgi:hypothetical protein
MNGSTRCSANVEDRETKLIFGRKSRVKKKPKRLFEGVRWGLTVPALMRAKAPRAWSTRILWRLKN